jgi:hypothetical protein
MHQLATAARVGQLRHFDLQHQDRQGDSEHAIDQGFHPVLADIELHAHV